MKIFWIIVGIIIIIALLLLLVTFICFYLAFYSPKRRPNPDRIDIPEGKIYEPYREQITQWIKEARALPHQDVSIVSEDGLTLRGRYYEYAADAPIELMFHGYRGNAERDLGGGVYRCFSLKRNVLVVDQRASGYSDGHIITFGVKESKDCLLWVKFLIEKFGPDVRIILTGISMGAATVLMAAGNDLPSNIVHVLADCGYSSQKDIIKKVIRQIKLPADLLYPFVKLGGKIFGHFDLEETTPVEAMIKCKVPVIFFHGNTDDFVPCEMSKINYDACNSYKKLVITPGAGHGLCYMKDMYEYYKAIQEFNKEIGFEY